MTQSVPISAGSGSAEKGPESLPQLPLKIIKQQYVYVKFTNWINNWLFLLKLSPVSHSQLCKENNSRENVSSVLNIYLFKIK